MIKVLEYKTDNISEIEVTKKILEDLKRLSELKDKQKK